MYNMKRNMFIYPNYYMLYEEFNTVLVKQVSYVIFSFANGRGEAKAENTNRYEYVRTKLKFPDI